MNELDDLLTRLEQLSARLADISEIQTPGAVDPVQALALIQQRGKMMEQLQPILAAHAPVSYIDWNRLVVIHHQGSRILENMRQVRSQVALEVAMSNSGRVFLERITGMLAPAFNRS